MTTNGLVAINATANSAKDTIDLTLPYRVEVEITGAATILFHRWQSEDIDEKNAAPKGSRAKKIDNLETYVYRCENGNLAIPGTYLIRSMTNPGNGAAKYRQDPRSPRKSALDLYKAAVIPITELADLGVKDWDFEHRERAVIQGNGITRVRPALHPGWKVTFVLMVTMPEYIAPSDLHDTINLAGRAVGLADHRPTYGRFNVTRFEILSDT